MKPEIIIPAERPPQDTLELVQWIAFVTMVIDHVGAYVLPEHSYWLRFVGRVAFPLFAVVFAWRLSHSLWKDPSYGVSPMLARLFFSGVAAQIAWIGLGEGSYLNIMFTFAVAIVTVILTDFSRPMLGFPDGLRIAAATVLMAVAGLHVEYGYPGLLLMLTLYSYCRYGERGMLIASGGALLIVALDFHIHAAVLAAPIFAFLVGRGWGLRRPVAHLFYWLYPAHIFGVLAITIVLASSRS